MAIKVGKKRRRIGVGGAPQLQAGAGDLGASALEGRVRRGISEVGRGIQTLAKGAGDLATGIGQSRANVQEKKDKVAALEAENNIAVDFNRRLGELKRENQGSKSSTLAQTWDDEIESLVSKHTQKLSPGAQARAREAIEAAKLRSRIEVQNYTVDELNKAEIQARQNKLENAATQIQNEPTASNYLVGRAAMMAEVDAASLSPEAKEALKTTVSDKLATAYFMGKQPSEAVVEIEAMKDDKLDPRLQVVYESMSAEGKQKLEKELRLRERNFKIAKDNADIEYDNDLILNVMKDAYTAPEARQAKTKEGARAVESVLKNKGKEVDATTQKDQYNTMLEKISTAEDPRKITNAEIVSSVQKGEDAKRLMGLRDSIVDETLNSVRYKDVINALGNDYDAGKFGKKEGDARQETDREYMDVLRTLENWAMQNKDKDPAEFYDILMEPKNARLYDNFSWGADTDISPEDLKIAREIEDAIIATVENRREHKREWLRNAKIQRQDYTIQELSDFYDAEAAKR
jgi:X-X-X-Leu-X-X-Gly heptad repeat protein